MGQCNLVAVAGLVLMILGGIRLHCTALQDPIIEPVHFKWMVSIGLVLLVVAILWWPRRFKSNGTPTRRDCATRSG